MTRIVIAGFDHDAAPLISSARRQPARPTRAQRVGKLTLIAMLHGRMIPVSPSGLS
jgi:hypothetical protein